MIAAIFSIVRDFGSLIAVNVIISHLMFWCHSASPFSIIVACDRLTRCRVMILWRHISLFESLIWLWLSHSLVLLCLSHWETIILGYFDIIVAMAYYFSSFIVINWILSDIYQLLRCLSLSLETTLEASCCSLIAVMEKSTLAELTR